MDDITAARFARLALDCVTREYPNKIAHVLYSDADAQPPRVLTPAFYGCFDWHSAVHGHWLLARLAGLFPDAVFAKEARAALEWNITPETIAGEAAYLKSRPGFERPYGLAWLLVLHVEWPVPELAETAMKHISDWLPKLKYPDRSGQHFNTAFSLGLLLDSVNDGDFRRLLVRRARDFYLADRNAPVTYEPSGEDFLSPSLAEADLMRRVLPADEFAPWLAAFLPDVSGFAPVASTDPQDGKLAHADGLNLSRAWMLRSLGYAELA
ncbi:MAG: DUF2891 domain-containing protein, partial [Acidobacteriota bacterium]